MGTKLMVMALTMMIGLPAMAADFTSEQAEQMATILRAQEDGTILYRSEDSAEETFKFLNNSEVRITTIGSSLVGIAKGKGLLNDEVINPATVYLKQADGQLQSLPERLAEVETEIAN